MKKKARTLLQQVLLEHLEQEISQVPEEQEIRKQHSFSDKFVEDMEKLTSEQDRVIRMEKKNKQKTRRRLFVQVAAACLAIVILFGAGAAALSTIRMGSSKGTDQSYDTAAPADSGAGGIYNGSEYKEEASMEMEAAEAPAKDYAASEQTAAEEGISSEISDSAAMKTNQKLIYTIHMEMETTEQNKVALYLFNNINIKLSVKLL